MIDPITKIEYNIYDLGFDKNLIRSLPNLILKEGIYVPSYLLASVFLAGEETSPSSLTSGEIKENLTLVDGYFRSANFVTGVSGWRVLPTGDVEFNSGVFRGSLIAASIHIPDENTTANSFHCDTTGNVWWGCTHTQFDADPNNAIAYILNTGAAKLSNLILTGLQAGSSVNVVYLAGVIAQTNLNVANRGWSQTCAFSVTDADTVAWATGTFKSADGTEYSIDAGNTGNMSVKTYIYLDTGVSTTAYQVNTTYTPGAGKVLVAVAQNGTGEATFWVLDGGGQNIDAASIVANSITANELAASITYTGSLIISTNGLIRMGATGYMVGAGIWMGYDGGLYKAHWGDPSGDYMAWNGANLISNKFVLIGTGSFGGNGADGALSISSGTTTLSLASEAIFVKNYTSISITSTGQLAFSNKHTNGTFILLKSQANVVLTSSASPCIDCSGLGGTGGSGGYPDGGDGDYGIHFAGKTNPGGGGWFGGTQRPGPGGVISFLPFINSNKRFGCGAGGGGGGAPPGGSGGAGGAGGGAILIECAGDLNFTAIISVAGKNGNNGVSGGYGGGGGAGGTILIRYVTATSTAGTLTVSGGSGGTPATTNGAGGGGGSIAGSGTTGGGGSGGPGAAGISLIVSSTEI